MAWNLLRLSTGNAILIWMKFLKLHRKGSLDLRNTYHKLVQPSCKPAIGQNCLFFIVSYVCGMYHQKIRNIIFSIIYKIIIFLNLLSFISLLSLSLSIVLVLLFICCVLVSIFHISFFQILFLNIYHRSFWLWFRHCSTSPCVLVWCLYNTLYVYLMAK